VGAAQKVCECLTVSAVTDDAVHALRMADGAFESSARTLQWMIHLLIVDAKAENFHVQLKMVLPGRRGAIGCAGLASDATGAVLAGAVPCRESSSKAPIRPRVRRDEVWVWGRCCVRVVVGVCVGR